jgi:hypothetical protein
VLEEIGLFPATREGETQGRCLPVVTEEDINDRSKSDVFTKAFAVMQCAWLVTQCITRAAVGLPLTELELMTLAFIIAALVMYLLWWYKPFDVQRATRLACPHERTSEVRSHLGNLETRKQWRRRNVTFEDVMDRNRIANGKAAGIAFANVGVIISSLHIAAWNWDFPSHTIQILWIVFSVVTTCCFPLLYFAIGSLQVDDIDKLPKYRFYDLLLSSSRMLKTFAIDKEASKKFFLALLLSILAIYIISRLGLIFLVFYCFSSMPAVVYETVNWNTIFPHFS